MEEEKKYNPFDKISVGGATKILYKHLNKHGVEYLDGWTFNTGDEYKTIKDYYDKTKFKS